MGPGQWMVDLTRCISSRGKGVQSALIRVSCQMWLKQVTLQETVYPSLTGSWGVLSGPGSSGLLSEDLPALMMESGASAIPSAS